MNHPRTLAVFAALSLSCLPAFAWAATDDAGWSGSGELGLANATGNTKSLNVDVKLRLSHENDTWKQAAFLDANRAKSSVKTPIVQNGVTVGQIDTYQTTANHFDVGDSVGYKFSPRSYLTVAARYDHDAFASNRWQAVASVGFGYILFKTARSELSLEAGPGYKRYQPQSFTVIDTSVSPPVRTVITPPADSEVIGRGLIDYKLAITDNVSLHETFLAEVGSENQYYQNDIGIQVAMTRTLALKVAYQNRYNSNIVPGIQHMDSLFTTNLVYQFGASQ